MSVAFGMLTVDFVGIGVKRQSGKAFGHAVMEKMTAQSEGGRGPAECGVAIGFLMVVTL